MNFSIRALVLMVALVPTLLASLAVSGSLMRARFSDMALELEMRGRREASHLSSAAQLAMLVGDVDSLGHLARSNLRGVDAAAAVVFADADGAILAEAGDGGDIALAQRCLQAADRCSTDAGHFVFRETITAGASEAADSGVFDGNAPTAAAETRLGEVLIMFRPEGLQQARRRFLVEALLLTGGIALIAALAATWFSRRLSIPIQQLSDVVARIRAGDLQARALPAGVGELRSLEIGVNEMADRVAASEADLNRRVDESTADLSLANLALERRNADLDAALRRADEAGRAKDMFLARMSHEMRTPLSSVVSCARLIEGSTDERQREEHVALIRSACDVLRGIIDDVLDFQKIASGAIEVEQAPFDLHRMADTVMRMLAAEPNAAALRIGCRIDEGVPRLVSGDELRLKQVLFNLVGNAIKFTPSGSVDLELSCGEDESVRITVADTGIGITEQQQERLFQPFSQADETTSRRFGGSGLGLAISKALTEALGGGLELRSTPGLGTKVTLTVPLREVDDAEVQASAVAARVESVDAVSVLVVDDNDLNRRLIASELSGLGATVSDAPSGPAALAALAQKDFDIVITDVNMPDMDGVALSQRIRERWPQLPVYALTANAIGTELSGLIDAGVRGVLLKPFDHDEVAELLAIWSQTPVSDGLRSETGVGQQDVVGELSRLRSQLHSLLATDPSSVALTDVAHEMLGVARLFCRGALLAACSRLHRSVRAGAHWVIDQDLRRLDELLASLARA